MQVKQWISIFVIALTLCACAKSSKKIEKPPIAVTVGKVSKSDTKVYLDAIGNANGKLTIDVRAQVTGVLKKAHVSQGAFVEEGELVYTIDPDPYEAQLAKAKAQLAKDEASLQLAIDKAERYRDLAKKDYISQLEYDELISEVKLKEAQVAFDVAEIADAEINLNYCFIRSPIAGKLSYNVFDQGNLIVADNSQQMTTIQQITPIDIHMTLSQRDFIRLQEAHGQKDKIPFDFIIQEKGIDIVRSGHIYFIDNSVSLDTGMILLKGTIANEDRTLWPGEFGKARILLKTVPHALLAPKEAVMTGQKGPYVFVVKDNDTVELRQVKTGVKSGDSIQIEEGVKEGETLVTDGQVNLRNGSKVTVKEKEAS